MREVELVIKISEKEYEAILNNDYRVVCARPYLLSEAIKNGTPLPKGHGRLIDAKDAVKELFDHAPTIIEADKEEL